MTQQFKFSIPVEISYKSARIEGYSYDWGLSKTKIKDFSYSLDITFNKAGVDSIGVDVLDQTVLFEIELTNEASGESEVVLFETELSDISIDRDIEDFSLVNGFEPKRLDLTIMEISLKTKKAKASGVLFFRS